MMIKKILTSLRNIVNRKTLFIIGVGISVFILYWPVLNGQFLLDDFSSIVKNHAIRSLDIGKIIAFSSFRFIGYLSFALNFHFSKLSPYFYYIVNICIHIFFVVMYFLFLQMLWQTPSGKTTELSDKEKDGLAMACALLFAVHPMSSFSISYIVQRLASLTGVFYISCLFFYIKIRLVKTLPQKISYSTSFFILLFCALFTKQNAFTIFPAIILIEIFCFDLTKRKILMFSSGLGILIFVFILLAAFNVIDLNELQRFSYETKTIGRFEYFTTQFTVICFYLSQIFIPDRLAIDYQSTPFSSYIHPEIIISGLILALIISFAIFMGFKKRYKLAGFGILFYFTAISIESSIIPIRDLVFIHRTYLPNAGMFFTITILLYMVIKRFHIPLYLSGIIFCLSVVIFTALTWKTNIMFQDPLKVWQRVVAISPGHARGYAHIGMNLISLKRYEEAEENILKAVSLDDREVSTLNNLGVIYSKTKQYDKAIELYKKIIKIKKKYVQAYVNLGNTYSDTGNYNMAIETYRQGYKYNKNNFEMLLNLGKHLAFAGSDNTERLHEALEFLEQAQKINDKHPVLYYSKGIAFSNLKDYNQAKNNFSHALDLDPNFTEARIRLEKIK